MKICTLITAAVLLSPLAPMRAEDTPPDPQFKTYRNEQSPDAEMAHRMAREQAKQRQKQLQEDTDKLFQLATELKQSVEKSNEHTLSLEVIRKTEEIEKLSRHIREKMKAGEF